MSSQVEFLDEGPSSRPRFTPWIAVAALVLTVALMLGLALLRTPPLVSAERVADIYRPSLATPDGQWRDPEPVPANTFGTWPCIGRLSRIFGAADVVVRARASHTQVDHTGGFADAEAAQDAFGEIDQTLSGCVQERFRWTRDAVGTKSDAVRFARFHVETVAGNPEWLRRDVLVVQRANTVAVFVAHEPPSPGVSQAYAARVDELARR